ncbi:MAG: transposase [Ignavibacteriae bacterium]|nr:transposase [Ignavibacteriota bacterium]
MSDKFKNKYRIESARLQSWDYGNNGAYFITICTKNREHFFGVITNEEMHLNETGKLADEYWVDIPNHYPFIELGNYTVMPNHVHGILIIEKSDFDKYVDGTNKDSDVGGGDAINRVCTDKRGGVTGEKNPMFYDNISRIIRWYKGRCTFEIHKINPGFGWHPRFHDHIIRDAGSFERIQNYIADNPKKWNSDKFYKKRRLKK